MQASPYGVSSYGLEPVAIETPEGKAEYVRHQRTFAARGAALRERLVAVCDALLPPDGDAAAALPADAPTTGAPGGECRARNARDRRTDRVQGSPA